MDTHFHNVGMATTERKVLCSVPDLAAMLSIGRTAAWELIRTHTIRSVKIGRTRRVPLSAIQDYLERLLDEEIA